MRRDEVQDETTALAFEFFFRFSRFEFSLKENNYLKNENPGAKAEPGWEKFVEKWHKQYALSPEAKSLCDANPLCQIVGLGQSPDWKPVGTGDCKSHLAIVIRLLKTIRNNLFHGGKHGAATWDDQQRTRSLLKLGIVVLGQLAVLAQIEDDYECKY